MIWNTDTDHLRLRVLDLEHSTIYLYAMTVEIVDAGISQMSGLAYISCDDTFTMPMQSTSAHLESPLSMVRMLIVVRGCFSSHFEIR